MPKTMDTPTKEEQGTMKKRNKLPRIEGSGRGIDGTKAASTPSDADMAHLKLPAISGTSLLTAMVPRMFETLPGELRTGTFRRVA